MHPRLTPTIAVGLAALLMLGTPAFAEEVIFSAQLLGSAAVPPNDSAGSGSVEATLDTETKVFKWSATYEGLTGPATAAHFHGPADPGQTAGPVVPVEDLESPMEGEATLDDAQIADLQAGKWYFNIHTAQYPDGEIRGQLQHSAD